MKKVNIALYQQDYPQYMERMYTISYDVGVLGDYEY